MPVNTSNSDVQIILDALAGIEARLSDDVVKTSLELTCVACDEIICDVEHRDTLSVLASTALDHKCVRNKKG